MGKLISTATAPVQTEPLELTDLVVGNDISKNGGAGKLVQIPLEFLKTLLLGAGVEIGGSNAGDVVTVGASQTLSKKTLIGAELDEMTTIDLNGVTTQLSEELGKKATVTAMTSALADKADASTTTAALAAKADASALSSGLAAKADAVATTSALAAKAPIVGVATLSTTLKITTGVNVTVDEVTAAEIFAALGMTGVDETTHYILARTVVMNLSKWFSTYTELVTFGTKGGTIPTAKITFSGNSGAEALTKIDLDILTAETDYSLNLSFKIAAIPT